MGMEFITTCCVVYFYYSHGELQTRGEKKKTRVPVGIGNSHSIKFDMSALIIQVYAISNNDTLFSKYDWIGNYSFKTFILKGDILLCLISLSQDNLVLVGVLTFTIYITARHLTLDATKVQSFANPFY